MTTISNTEFHTEVSSIVASIIDEVESCIKSEDPEAILDHNYWFDVANDCIIHDTIDSHQWVIYTHKAQQVCILSDKTDEVINEELVDANDCIVNGGLSRLYTALAYWALYFEVQDLLSDAIQKRIDTLVHTFQQSI
jgi:hypothetical protein